MSTELLELRESEASVMLAAGIGSGIRPRLHQGSSAHPVVHSMATTLELFPAFCGASATGRDHQVFPLHLLQDLQHLE